MSYHGKTPPPILVPLALDEDTNKIRKAKQKEFEEANDKNNIKNGNYREYKMKR